MGKPQRLGLTSEYSDLEHEAALDKVKQLLALWEAQNTVSSTEGNDMSDEQKIFELGMQLLRQAEVGPVDGFQELLMKGVPINFQHPKHRYTALHMAASGDTTINHQLVSILLDSDQSIDFLIEDEYGRIPWHNAILFGLNEALRKRIYEETLPAAKEEGFDLQKDFKQKMKKWMNEYWYLNLARANGSEDMEP